MTVKSFIRILLVISILAVMIGIFLLSDETQVESEESSDAFVNPIIKLFYPDYDEMDASKQYTALLSINVLIRTGAHYSEYLVLGALCVGLALTFKSKRVSLYILIPLGAGVIYAILDEIHQLFVPGRCCQISDVIIDTCGTLTGILIIFTIVCIIKTRNEKQKDIVDNQNYSQSLDRDVRGHDILFFRTDGYRVETNEQRGSR